MQLMSALLKKLFATRMVRYSFPLLFCPTYALSDGDQSLGLMIVSGKARNSNGDVAEGVFVQKVLPGSLAEKDGRYYIL